MQNVAMTRDGDKLIIEVDLTKNFGKSKSGKTDSIATTNGFVSIPESNDIKIGLNVYKK